MLDTIKKVNRKKIEQASFVCLFCYALFFISCNGIESTKGRRILTISQNCTLTPKKEVGPHDTPIFAASFPGSGARVGWQLIQGLTGKPIGDEWNSNGLGRNVIAVKTHWPHPTHGHQIEWEKDIKRVFLLVRNPMYALSGFHNVIYSSTHNDELGSNVSSKNGFDFLSVFFFSLGISNHRSLFIGHCTNASVDEMEGL